MALTADFVPNRRGMEPTRNEFGYPLAPGEVVFRGSIVGLNAAQQIQRVQTGGTVVLLGLSNINYNNAGAATPGPIITPMKGTYGLAVPAAAAANINAPVYATDDSTLTLSSNSGANLPIGTLVGIDLAQVGGAATFVNIIGS